MSKSMVREALVTSVAWTAPPVSFHSSQASTVPNRISPRRAFSRAPSTWSSTHLILVAEKYASGTKPVEARMCSSSPSARSRSTNSAVRRHCQTMAL